MRSRGKIIGLMAVLLAGFLAPVAAFAQQSAAPLPGSVADVVQRGQTRLDRGDWSGALSILKTAPPAGESDPALQSALSRAYSEIGEDTPAGSNAQEANYQQALDHAKKELQLAPNSAQAHLDLSITTGKLATVSGAGTKLKLAPIVADEARRTLELDPSNWRAYHVLGVWNREIATLGGFKKFGASLMGGLPKASLEDAISNLEKADSLAPGSIRNHLELARTYEKAKRDADARAQYQKAVSLPPSEPRDAELQRQARAELAELS
jgi:tetratricopeptide (TPR) repeat protein